MSAATLRPAVALEAGGDAPPEWVQLLPSGPAFTARDGRRWVFGAAEQVAVIAAFDQNGADLPIDWEHATQLQAPAGRPAPAAGWIRELQARAGALWGRVTWTAQAAAQLLAREYRYLSPVFDFDPATGRIARLVSAGLVNKPALTMRALNTEGGNTMSRPLNGFELEVCRAAGVDPTAFAAIRDEATEVARCSMHSAYPGTRHISGTLSEEERRICDATGVEPAAFMAARDA